MRNAIAALSIAATLMCAAPMTHAAQQEHSTLASPELVAAAGFPAGATVYVAAPVEAQPEFFGTQPAMTTFAGNKFQGRISTYAYTTLDGSGSVTYAGGDPFADAHVDLPTGVILDNVRWWTKQTVACMPATEVGCSDILFFMVQSCLPAAGPGNPSLTILGMGSTDPGGAGNQSGVVTLPSTVIDNNACHYWFRARFGSADMTLQKARLQWHRQVSAAPATATFPNDVPTTNPFFRFVEAIAASGLTGGCGPGAFCPNDPVTRGQMAVFLSTALGLHFPN